MALTALAGQSPPRNRERDIVAFLAHIRPLVSFSTLTETEKILRGEQNKFYYASLEEERIVRYHANNKSWNVTLPQ